MGDLKAEICLLVIFVSPATHHVVKYPVMTDRHLVWLSFIFNLLHSPKPGHPLELCSFLFLCVCGETVVKQIHLPFYGV